MNNKTIKERIEDAKSSVDYDALSDVKKATPYIGAGAGVGATALLARTNKKIRTHGGALSALTGAAGYMAGKAVNGQKLTRYDKAGMSGLAAGTLASHVAKDYLKLKSPLMAAGVGAVAGLGTMYASSKAIKRRDIEKQRKAYIEAMRARMRRNGQ